MPYTHIQLMGYRINTFPILDDIVNNKYNPESQRYLGIADAGSDIKRRCEIMSDAIHVTRRKAANLDRRLTTLKLFMAPEFYFRGAEGAYPLDKVSGILEEMRLLTRQAVYGDWLFVFGTALGYIAAGTGGQKEVFNVALVQKGGVDDGGGEWNRATGTRSAPTAFVVYKEYISHIDFLRQRKGFFGGNLDWSDLSNRKVVIGGPEAAASPVRPTKGSRDVRSTLGPIDRLLGRADPWAATPTGDGAEQNRTGIGGGNLFEMDNITFGLEVCLDHARARLRSSPPAVGQRYAQVQLIPSAGMSIQRRAVAVPGDGIIFNVDGGGSKAHVDANINWGTYPAPKLREVGRRGQEVESVTVDLGANAHTFFRGDQAHFFIQPQHLRTDRVADHGTVAVYRSLPLPVPAVR